MLSQDKMSRCDECNEIVSGGFGGFKDGKHHFTCMDCADNWNQDRVNLAQLNIATDLDPSKEESYE